MLSEWGNFQVVDADGETMALAWLESKDLGTYAAKIVEVTDANTLADLKLIDDVILENVIEQADLKLVTAKKLRTALNELQCERPKHELVAEASVPLAVQECVAVCIDRSGSMVTPLAEVTLNVVKGTTKDSVAERTRMEAVKAMFYAFRDRVESMGRGAYQLGLFQFDNQVEQLLDLTPELDRFESIVDDMQKRGQTAIYSAIIGCVHAGETFSGRLPDRPPYSRPD